MLSQATPHDTAAGGKMTAKMARVVIFGIGVVLGLYGWLSHSPVAFVGLVLIALAIVLQLTRHRGSR